jgi:hypothetical protein
VDAGIDEGQEAIHHLHARRRIVGGEGIGAQEHGGAADFFRERLADAGAVGADHLGLEQLDVLDLDAGVLERPTPVLKLYIIGASSCIQVLSM